MESKKPTGRNYVRKSTQWEIWRDKVEKLKSKGCVPHVWLTPLHLAHFLARIDHYLLYLDHVAIFNLMGQKIRATGDERDKPWIALETLKKLMDNPEYLKIGDELLKKSHGDDLQLLGRRAQHQLGALIDERHFPAVMAALEMAGKYVRKFQKVETEKEKAERIKKLVEGHFKPSDVAELEGDH